MHSKDFSIQKMYGVLPKNLLSQNIRRVEFIRRQVFENSPKKQIFSNNILKNTISSLKSNEQAFKKKMQNSYSPKKQSIVSTNIHIKNKNINPYKLSILQSKKMQNLMMASLQSSIQIKRHPISSNSIQNRQYSRSIFKPGTTSVERFYQSNGIQTHLIKSDVKFINRQNGQNNQENKICRTESVKKIRRPVTSNLSRQFTNRQIFKDSNK